MVAAVAGGVMVEDAMVNEGRCERVDELVTGVAISRQYDVGSNGVPPGKRASYTGGKGGFNKRCYLPR